MEQILLDEASVDVIISNGVINLSAEKGQTFRELYRVLKPGGRLIFSEFGGKRSTATLGARQRGRLCWLTGRRPLGERAYPRSQERRFHQRTDFNKRTGGEGPIETLSPVHHRVSRVALRSIPGAGDADIPGAFPV